MLITIFANDLNTLRPIRGQELLNGLDIVTCIMFMYTQYTYCLIGTYVIVLCGIWIEKVLFVLDRFYRSEVSEYLTFIEWAILMRISDSTMSLWYLISVVIFIIRNVVRKYSLITAMHWQQWCLFGRKYLSICYICFRYIFLFQCVNH